MFTVAEGRTVRFSRGNLQYQASTGTWRFAEHQYDRIGEDNANLGEHYSGWIDLFGYGTSGWNSGCLAYQPWSRYDSYGRYFYSSLTGVYANADWGVYNAISNGGNQAGMWRTLTKDEWDYLLFTRNGSTYGMIEDVRFLKATVGGVNGLIVFPDSFTMPSGMLFLGINNTSIEYRSNIYTTQQWSQIEGNGAIFLPATGSRVGTEVFHVDDDGCYWSSTIGGSNIYAYGMWFSFDRVSVGNDDIYSGNSVRLVRD